MEKKNLKKDKQDNRWKELKKEIEKLAPTTRINELKKLLKEEKNQELVKEIKSDIEQAMKELQQQRSIRISGSEEMPRTRVNLETGTSAVNREERNLDSIVETEVKDVKEQAKTPIYGTGGMGGTQGPYSRGTGLYQNPNNLGSRDKYTSTTSNINDERSWQGRTRGFEPSDSRWQAHMRASSDLVADDRWRANVESTSGFTSRVDEEKVIKSEEILYKETKYRRGENGL